MSRAPIVRRGLCWGYQGHNRHRADHRRVHSAESIHLNTVKRQLLVWCVVKAQKKRVNSTKMSSPKCEASVSFRWTNKVSSSKCRLCYSVWLDRQYLSHVMEPCYQSVQVSRRFTPNENVVGLFLARSVIPACRGHDTKAWSKPWLEAVSLCWGNIQKLPLGSQPKTVRNRYSGR